MVKPLWQDQAGRIIGFSRRKTAQKPAGATGRRSSYSSFRIFFYMIIPAYTRRLFMPEIENEYPGPATMEKITSLAKRR
ncbi:MAG: hypothetical protein LBT87_08735, partial [Treponema sp.]|nr:hypothetical protein [Treponema sp.]